ncbi:cupin domain-containing protein [Longitalea luteola]|uniref:cupin domain-containing protein n=1 Tax=Longitalea luteola TaxID=2812563 RepID=UPI001A95FD4F|nr:cupin domain-containing protein [Longitalea luteola]
MKKTAFYAMAMLLVPWLSCTDNPVQNLANPPSGTKARMILPPVHDTVLQSGRRNIYLAGHRNQPGFFIERYIFPPGYKGMPHVHNSDLHVTILSGSAHIVMDKVFDTTVNAMAYGPGSYVIIKADQPHYEWFTEECTMQVAGIGPNETYYIPEAETKKQ